MAVLAAASDVLVCCYDLQVNNCQLLSSKLRPAVHGAPGVGGTHSGTAPRLALQLACWERPEPHIFFNAPLTHSAVYHLLHIEWMLFIMKYILRKTFRK